MRIFLLVLSVIWVALGAAIVLYTQQARRFLREYVLAVNVKIWAFVAIAVGVLFLVGALLVKEVLWICLILGLLAMAKGAYFALSPPAQSSALLEWWFDRAGESTIRLWGLVAFTFGVVLISWLL